MILSETIDQNCEFVFEDVKGDKDYVREFDQFTVFKIWTCYWNDQGEYFYIWMLSKQEE